MRPCVLAFAILAISGSPAFAQWGMQTPGFNYFQKPGADLVSHDQSMRDCDVEARKTSGQYINTMSRPGNPGLLDGYLNKEIKKGVDRRQLLFNIEACMIIRGWSVVRPSPVQQNRLSSLSQEELREYLSSRVGALDPLATVARRYDPEAPVLYKFEGIYDPPKTNLSYRVVFGLDSPDVLLPIADATPANWFPIARVKTPTDLAPDATVVVVRTHGNRPGQQMTIRFMRIGPGDPAAPPLSLFYVSTPTKMFWKAGTPMESVVVYEVPPGRWIMAGDTGASYCLDAPSFEVKAGEAVFAGTFSSAIAGDMQPKMDLGEAGSRLPASLASRLRPAAWENGLTFDCSYLMTAYLAGFEVPAAPRIADADRPTKDR